MDEDIVTKCESFKSNDLRCVIPGDNNNDAAFVVAIIKDIGLVVEDWTTRTFIVSDETVRE